MSVAIANQMGLAFLGRGLDTGLSLSTGSSLNGRQPSKSLLDQWFQIAVADGVFSSTDFGLTIVNKVFNNIFGRDALPFEQAAWANLSTFGGLSKGELVWGIWSGYLGATNVPDAYKIPAQSRLVATQAYTDTLAINPTANAAASQIGSSASQTGRDFLSGVVDQGSAAAQIALAPSVVFGLSFPGPITSPILTAGLDSIVGTGGNDVFDGTLGITSTLNTNDRIDGGTGLDILVLTSSTSAPVSTAPILDNVEGLILTGTGAANINFNAVIGLQVVDHETSGDLIASSVASETLFEFGPKSSISTTEAFFTMKKEQSALNLKLDGTSTLDADIRELKTGAATQINIQSNGPQGTIVFGGDRSFANDIGFVSEYAPNAVFAVTGDASTAIAGGFFGGSTGVTLNGGNHRGDLYVTGSALNDKFIGGSGNNMFRGLEGFDVIDLSRSTFKIDEVRLWDVTRFEDRDVITGFQTGFNGDEIEIRASNTSAFTSAFDAPTYGVITSPTKVPTTLNIGAFDIIEFDFEVTAGPLDIAGAGSNLLFTYSNNGFNLISATPNASGYLIAYADGDAALLYVENDSLAGLGASEIELVGIVSNVAVGSLSADNFDLV